MIKVIEQVNIIVIKFKFHLKKYGGFCSFLLIIFYITIHIDEVF